MYMKFEINRTKIKGGCQLGRKVVPHDSKNDLILVEQRYPKSIIMQQQKFDKSLATGSTLNKFSQLFAISGKEKYTRLER